MRSSAADRANRAFLQKVIIPVCHRNESQPLSWLVCVQKFSKPARRYQTITVPWYDARHAGTHLTRFRLLLKRLTSPHRIVSGQSSLRWLTCSIHRLLSDPLNYHTQGTIAIQQSIALQYIYLHDQMFQPQCLCQSQWRQIFCHTYRVRRLCLTIVFLVTDRKSTRLNSSHSGESRMPSSA